MNHTTNLHLPQWEKTDRLMMDDFNDAFAAIDAGVAAKADGATVTALQSAVNTMPKIAVGSYTGNYTQSGPNTSLSQSISLPFTPKAVIIRSLWTSSSSTVSFDGKLGMATVAAPLNNLLVLGENQFTVTGRHNNGNLVYPALNSSPTQYVYVAIG